MNSCCRSLYNPLGIFPLAFQAVATGLLQRGEGAVLDVIRVVKRTNPRFGSHEHQQMALLRFQQVRTWANKCTLDVLDIPVLTLQY